MLTEVILNGAMGKRFGRKWSLNINKPSEALNIINANKPGLFIWIRDNLERFEHYKVVCEYHDGFKELMDNNSYLINNQRPIKSIRFTPQVRGAGGKQGILGMVLGAVLVIAAPFTAGASLAGLGFIGALGATTFASIMTTAGIGMFLGGALQLVSSLIMTDSSDNNTKKDGTNRYFDGAQNTSTQGIPVPLVYGEVITGSHPISVDLTVDLKWKPNPADTSV